MLGKLKHDWISVRARTSSGDSTVTLLFSWAFVLLDLLLRSLFGARQRPRR